MTQSPLDRVRAVALLLPGAEEAAADGQPTFTVEGAQFAQFRGEPQPVVCVKTNDAGEQAELIAANPAIYSRVDDLDTSGWIAMTLADDVDWALVEDRIAHSWELAAPRRLLEAGGR